MPRTRARGKTPRASKQEKALRDKLCRLALDMEKPLHEAIDLVQALNLMGYGMMGMAATGDERALVTVAYNASRRLETVKETWCEIFKTARRSRLRTVLHFPGQRQYDINVISEIESWSIFWCAGWTGRSPNG